MKHVRLMIFCNWISQKAGDKVPHTPLILPISTAGLKCVLLEQGKKMECKTRKNTGITDEEGVDCAITASGRTVAEVVPMCPNTQSNHHLCA